MRRHPVRRRPSATLLAPVVLALIVVAPAVLTAGALTQAVPAGGATQPGAVGARPSSGCSRVGQAPEPASPTQGTPFAAAGEDGAYILEPSGGPADVPHPVVFDLHAYQEPGAVQVVLSGLGTYGRTQGFTTVTPWITGQPVPLWHSVPGSPDLAWFGALLSHLETVSCVDEHRVFVTGYSNGAFFTSLIACRYASRVAAVAAVSGIQAESPCRASRPVPVVAFHGTADPLVHYDGSPSKVASSLPAPDGTGTITTTEAKLFGTRGIFTKGPPIPAEAAAWATRNGCSSSVTTTRIAPDVTRLAWACPARAAVELYRIRGGGHTWPGSADSAALSTLLGRTTYSISADATMWRFFRAHPLPSRS